MLTSVHAPAVLLDVFCRCFLLLFFPPDILLYAANKLGECEKYRVRCSIYYSHACIIPKQMTGVSEYITDKVEHPAGLGVYSDAQKPGWGKSARRVPGNGKRCLDLGNASAHVIKFTLRCSY